MTYQQAIETIHAIPWMNREPGLHRITELMELMGNPQDKLKFIHIAGSNGKGSCAATTASILKSAGYKTGLCISPYIHRFNERMQINGCPISDEELAEITVKVKHCADKMAEHPSEFEFVNAITFEYFARHNCDIAVIEVGLGGRFDATNVIKAPVAAVITAIGLEHTAILGDTVEKIAFEKAGIIKEGCKVVVSRQQQSVIDVVAGVCTQKGVELKIADAGIVRISQSEKGQVIKYNDLMLDFPLLGEHQLQNLSTVITVVDILRDSGFVISDEALKEGIASVKWPGRFELLNSEPIFFLDGGHNHQCAETVAKTLISLYPDKKILLLIGVLKDKDVKGIIEPVAPLVKKAVTITPPSPRAMDREGLAQLLKDEFNIPCESCETISDGVKKIMAMALADDIICAYGSLYSVADIRSCFGKAY